MFPHTWGVADGVGLWVPRVGGGLTPELGAESHMAPVLLRSGIVPHQTLLDSLPRGGSLGRGVLLLDLRVPTLCVYLHLRNEGSSLGYEGMTGGGA